MYIVEGNIGAGKSTFLTLLAQQIPYVTIALEPLHNWQKQVHGQSLLANFYQDPQRWAYTLETFTMMCRVREHLHEQTLAQQNPLKPRLIERSIYSGHYCFAHNSYANNFMTDLEWTLYEQWFTSLVARNCLPPFGFIYLKVNPDIAYDRIKKRNRISEQNLSRAYLEQINKRHEDFLINKIELLPKLQDVPLLIIDCDEEFEQNPAQLEKHTENVKVFIEEIQLKGLDKQKSRDFHEKLI